MGLITKGMGVILKHAKKPKVKKAKLKTVYRVKPDIYIEQFKKSKKHSLGEKFGVWSNRAAGKTLTEMGSGISVKFKKSGKPYVPKSEQKKSALKKGATRVKGWAKLTSPIAAAGTAGTIHAEIKKRKGKK